MLLIGALYAAGAVHPWGIARWVVIVSVFAFGLTFCATWGIVGKIYASEIQPANTRAAANCVALGMGFLTNFLVAIITPILLSKSAYGAYFLFGFLALGTVSVLAACMPETRGRSLEDIQMAFQTSGSPVGSWASSVNQVFGRIKQRRTGTVRDVGSDRVSHSSQENIALETVLAEGPVDTERAESAVLRSRLEVL